MARGLARRGHQVSVLTTTEGAGGENLSHGVEVKAVNSLPVPGYAGIRMGLATRRFFSRRIGDFKPDGIYVAVETLMGCNAIRAAHQCAKRVVSGFHTNFHSYSDDYRLPFFKRAAMWYLQWIHNRTARTLTPSESTAEQLRGLGIKNVGVLGRGWIRIFSIPNGGMLSCVAPGVRTKPLPWPCLSGASRRRRICRSR